MPGLVSIRSEGLAIGDTLMRFRLFYEGDFFSAKEDRVTDRRVDHKHVLRTAFHYQLKDLWQERKFLRETRTRGEIFGVAGSEALLSEKLAELSPDISGYRFVPLVHEKLDLTCSIKVLLMRRDRPGDRPGRIFQSRDIDNRLKVLFDALKAPTDVIELGSATPLPDGSDSPMYVLVQKDELISHVSVETDDLLAPPDSASSDAYARVLVDVEIGLWNVNMFNLGLG